MRRFQERGDVSTIRVVKTFLEMNAPPRYEGLGDRVDFVRVERLDPLFSWFLYSAVGADWHWTDRASWSREDWRNHFASEDAELWVGYEAGAPIGYTEYQMSLPDAVRIHLFGLLPSAIGRGLGKELLQRTVLEAWRRRPGRVWLDTCSLDAPAALQNYLARGFEIVGTEEEVRPAASCRPSWPE